MDLENKIEANRKSWSERVAIHATDTSGIYQFDAFFAGDNSITPIDDMELGDVYGLRLAHLQCHFGLDTIRLARRGAIATGLDFSEDAVKQARLFADKTGTDVAFVHANVYDAPEVLPVSTFDLVYVSWGAIYWLPDLVPWAKVIAGLLKPGGRLFLAEGHPSMVQMEQDDQGRLYHAYPPGSHQRFDEDTTYAGDGRELVHKTTYEWMHGLGDVIGSLLGAGLEIRRFKEYPTIPWPAFPCMIPTGDGMFRLPESTSGPPGSFIVDATKP
ncbi:MAG: class I SAM-dependent methyltransferase [Alphaproteobacteria bacterium]